MKQRNGVLSIETQMPQYRKISQCWRQKKNRKKL